MILRDLLTELRVNILRDKSGEPIPARDPKTGPLKPIEPAPGAYVKVKS